MGVVSPTMIEGTVISGSGGASKVPDDVQQERVETTGIPLVRGTLNVKVNCLDNALNSLGNPIHETQRDSPLGPLRWWPVTVSRVQSTGGEICAFVVRHECSRTRYLEVMSDTCFRKAGFEDGDHIHLGPRSVDGELC